MVKELSLTFKIHLVKQSSQENKQFQIHLSTDFEKIFTKSNKKNYKVNGLKSTSLYE